MLQGEYPSERRIPSRFLEFNRIAPLSCEDGVVVVGTSTDAVEQAVLDAVAVAFKATPVVRQISERELRAAIRQYCGDQGITAENVIAGLASDSVAEAEEALTDDLRSLANEAPVIQLVNLLLIEALDARASDVHLESSEAGVVVRYRIDGLLTDAPSPPRSLSAAVISRLKIMADLDIAESRAPQDGRIRLRLRNRQVDVRVATMPLHNGESVVLRLLDYDGARLSLDDIGLAGDTRDGLLSALQSRSGVFLVTGPTGSGKTTTLYALLDHLRTGYEKIITVEDPVEYDIPGVAQIGVNSRTGVSFASALRSILRQDPDIVLIGEIRDGETAAIAAQAALTGHLVLSTLHTTDSAGALTRLLDLGVPEYLIGSTLRGVLAQRLVRLVCSRCSGARCEACRRTGYRGRTGLYEFLHFEDVRDALPTRSAESINAAAVAKGMRSLRQDGMRAVLAGLTTEEEVRRTIGA